MSRAWWQDGVVYQIYPRSFMDANGDGVGDLAGIRAQLDHLQWLGVDAVWLSPCFPSPMADFGYDVSDYCDIDPLFGDLAELDALVADAHARGIRLVLDWVPNHSSDQHPWFVEARSGRDAATRDYFVWADPATDGGPPNNWRAAFGGPAWERDAASGQYYLHTFLAEQPELNWRNPELVREMHDVLRFWLDRGVDGFRIDVVHALAKHPELRDNPLVDGQVQPVHSHNHPDIHGMLRGVRGVLDEYEERMAVGEVYLMDPAEVARYYGAGDELHLAFNFSFLRCPWSAARFREEVERFEGYLPEGAWPTLVLSNHDVPRHASRYDDEVHGEARARLAAMLLLTLRGTPFLYYGEEIGMRNVAIPEAELQDPLAVTLHPKLARDGERTPMQWDSGPKSGFSGAAPWLPIGEDAARRNVAEQRADPDSLLHFYRALLTLRRAHPSLHAGSYAGLDAPEGVFRFQREVAGERAVIALNFADAPHELELSAGTPHAGLLSRAGAAPPRGRVTLAPAEGVVAIFRR